MKKKQWQFNWKITLFTALFLPLFVGLGCWQLQRADQKEQIEKQQQSRMQHNPQDILNVDAHASAAELAFLPVVLAGDADNEHNFLLDNSVHNGKVGFEVITPLRAGNGNVYLINRGWIQASTNRQQLPVIPPLKSGTPIQGYIYVPAGSGFTLGVDEVGPQWPHIISQLDTVEMGKRLQQTVFPYTIRLSQEMNDGLVRRWSAVNMTPAKHMAYAIQWFAMALALIILFVVSARRSPEAGGK